MQGEEVLVGAQLRVLLHHDQEPAECAGELGLVLLVPPERLLVLQDVRRQLHLRDLGPRLGHRDQHVLLLLGIALDGLDQVRDQIGPPLILVLYLGPAGIHFFLQRRNGVDAAAGQQHQEEEEQHWRPGSEAPEREGAHRRVAS